MKSKSDKSAGRRRGGIVRRIVLLTVVLIPGLCLATGGLFVYLMLPVESVSGDQAEFEIDRGASLSVIGDRLEEAGLVRSSLAFRVYGILMGSQDAMRSGKYRIPRGLGVPGIHDLLVQGVQVMHRVTIPEGAGLGQTARALEEAGICGADDFLAAARDPGVLEASGIPGAGSALGFLFPDTYVFAEGVVAGEVVEEMVRNFRVRLEGTGLEDLSFDELREKVILASIVEREYVAPEEAPLMASVFNNRLARGMSLESCATVVYVMTEEEGLPHPDRIFYADLKRQSPYNTYLHRGLPPGPICNPGSVALSAAGHPARSEYLFFVLKGAGDGRHHFSRSLAEHDEASVFYLKGRRSKS